jgi:ATP-binding cassette subfamily F protein uup
MESTIHAAEQVAEGIETKLNDAEFQAQHYEEIPELVAKLDAAKSEVARLYQRWEELEALRESLEK